MLSSMSGAPIKLYLQKERVLVWNAEDVSKIRGQHRIVGTQVGCFPRCPYQNVLLGLPVQFTMEEAHLLISKGFCVLVKNARLSQPPSDEERAHVDKCADDVYQQQVEVIMEQRKAEIKQYAENIVAGHVKKTAGQLVSKRVRKKLKKSGVSASAEGEDPGSSAEPVEIQAADFEAQKEAIIADVMKKRVSTPSQDITLAPVLYECLRTKTSDFVPAELNYPRSDAHKIRCRVFEDLWEKGHYMTVGSKFGGDFLVYSGDPLVFHAFGVVVCLGKDTKVAGRDMIMWGRLGNAVHKTIILATLRDDRVHYLSLRWSGEL
ncbi:tRNA-splicing endonuclease subunit Sen34-like [Dermacentor silvarum]|uniref:tRNA-splicing endonuclease subunit Sen34-like n=1 Tax=Dermacentor silvarum TaxID=543639 RepID=UPI0018982510|nr:tRNA-splicing endonuclease subunit Sen34-like [Dermacentor silvarum]